MSQPPTSHLMAVAQTKRARRRRGVSRAKILGALFAAAVVVGIISGVVAPGA